MSRVQQEASHHHPRVAAVKDETDVTDGTVSVPPDPHLGSLLSVKGTVGEAERWLRPNLAYDSDG